MTALIKSAPKLDVWIDFETDKPEEDGKWLKVRRGDAVLGYQVKWWCSENHENGGYFVNAGFGREYGITHWRDDV